MLVLRLEDHDPCNRQPARKSRLRMLFRLGLPQTGRLGARTPDETCAPVVPFCRIRHSRKQPLKIAFEPTMTPPLGLAARAYGFGPLRSVEAVISSATKRVKSPMSWRTDAFSSAAM